jgi:uncharacterized protein YjbJ (UPF0337 family)
MLNDEQFNRNWKEIKRGVRNLWGRISDDEVEKTHGNLSALTGLIQDRHGEASESVRKKIDQLLASFDNETDKSQERGESSYQRSPVGQDDKEEPNFTLGRDREGDESARNFNSSSDAFRSDIDSQEIFEDDRP